MAMDRIYSRGDRALTRFWRWVAGAILIGCALGLTTPCLAATEGAAPAGVNQLKDTHSWLQNYKVPLPSSGPGLTLDLVEDRFFVVAVDPRSDAAGAGIKAGAEALKIDEFTIEERLEQLKSQLPGRSTERRGASLRPHCEDFQRLRLRRQRPAHRR